MQINAVISEIVHCADKAGVVLEGGGLQLQPLGEGGHDAFAHLRGQRVDQQRLLCADAAANQNQLRVENVHKPPRWKPPCWRSSNKSKKPYANIRTHPFPQNKTKS